MHARWPLPILFFIAAPSASFAAPATYDDAKEIEQGYIAYFSRAVVDKGIVTVTPKGEDYLVTWDLQTALELANPPQGALHIGPFSYTLTPRGDSAWTLKADRLPSFSFDAPTDKGRVSGSVDLGGFHLEALFDAAEANFLRSLAAADALTAKFRIVDTAQRVDVDLAESEVQVETRAKASESGAGVDVALAQSVKHIAETVVTTPSGEQAAPITVTYEVGGVGGGATITGLRAREFGDLWKYLVAHIQDADRPPDLKQRVRATLPLWNDIRAEAEIHDLALQTPVVEAKLKRLGEKLGLSGFTEEGGAELGVKVDELAFKSALLPPWAGALSPVSLDLDLRVAEKGLDKAAQLALDDPGFGEKGDLSSETQDKIGAALLAGRPRMTLAPGRLTAPIIDLAFSGEATLETGSPSAHFTVSADSLDKTIALLQDVAKSEPDAQSLALGVVFAKGLATTGPDGRLVWKIDVSSTGDVTVNGNPLPKDK